MSLTLRDQYLKQCWVPTDLRLPPTDPRGPHHPVECWVIVDDPRFVRANGDKVFQDRGCYWPASNIWTVTCQTCASEDAEDVRANVTWWQPLPPLPW